VNPYCWPAYYNTANSRRRDAEETTDPQERNRLLEEAAQRYEKVAEIHLKIKQPFDQLISTRERQGKIDLAYDAAVRAGERFGGLPEYHHFAGKYALDLQKNEESYKHFLAAIQVYHATGATAKKNMIATCYEGASQAAIRLERWQDAELMAIKAAELYLLGKLNDKAAAAFSAAGYAAKKAGREKESQEYYNKASELLEKNAGEGLGAAQQYVSVAQIAASQGDMQRAQENYRKAIDIILEEAKARFASNRNVDAAKMLRQAGDGAKAGGWPDEAELHYRKAIDTMVAEAQLLYDDGRTSEGGVVMYHAALAANAAGWTQEAIDLYEKAGTSFDIAGEKESSDQNHCIAFKSYRNAFRMYRGARDAAAAAAGDADQPDDVQAAMTAARERLHEQMGIAHDAMEAARAKCEGAEEGD
jgi:tetratricopeptide (TPR) repeat protein